MRKILMSLGVITVVAGAVIGGTSAFFSDEETSAGNTFAAGVVDLKVDNESYYNGNVCTNLGTDEEPDWQWQGQADYPVPGTECETSFPAVDLDDGYVFFNFDDLKPDDEGEDTISLHADNDVWMCLDLSLTMNDDNGTTEPEGQVDDEDVEEDLWDGELAQNLQFVWWADDGDNVLESDEPLLTDGVQTLAEMTENGSSSWSVVLADSESNAWGEDAGVPVPGGETVYIAKAWCLGDLSLDPVNEGEGVNPSVASGIICDGEDLGNETQTDKVMLDVAFRAEQARHNNEFVCGEPERPVIACEITETFADEVISVNQGKKKDGTIVALNRSVANYALGAPQSLGTPYDNPVVPNSFFSLGFPAAPFGTSTGAAEIVLSFNDNYVVNATGSDLKLWEVTGGTSYPDEKVDVYVGNAPAGPWTLVGDDVTRDAEIDIAPISAARYVRIVDASNVGEFEATADGFDLDAVQALNCILSPIN